MQAISLTRKCYNSYCGHPFSVVPVFFAGIDIGLYFRRGIFGYVEKAKSKINGNNINTCGGHIGVAFKK